MWQRFGQSGLDGLFVLAAMSAAVAESMSEPDTAAAWATGAIGGIGALALWWRRAHPVAITMIGLVVVALTGVPLALFVGLFSMAARRRDRTLVAVGALSVAVLAVKWSTETDDGWLRLGASAVAGVGFAVAAGAYVGARSDLVQALRERAERADADQNARAEQARLAERARIAREMHDIVAHKVCLVAMHAGALEVMPSPTRDQVATTGELIRTTAHEAMNDLREVLGVLGPTGTGRLPSPRLDDIVRAVEASRSAGADVTLHIDVEELSDPIARAAHRIVTEGLTNVHKHAAGAATTVSISDSGAGLTVEVVNDRPPGSVPIVLGAGVGLHGLAERARLIGGTCEAGPRDGGGWQLSAFMPWGTA
jgi:signal transduction histidine kinase